MKNIKISLVTFSICLMASVCANAASGITYHGRILRSDGSPVDGQFVGFRLRIMDGDTGSCQMYEEIQTKDMRNANGVFSIVIGDGSVVGTYGATGISFFDGLFQNAKTYNFAVSHSCELTPYSALARHGRKLNVSFRENPAGAWEDMPTMNIEHVPFAYSALTAQKVGNHGDGSLLRVENAGAPQNISALTPTQYSELFDLVQGNSTQYVQSVLGTASQITVNTAAGVATVGLADVATAGTYGSATQVPVFTMDAKGRITSVTNTTITGAAPTGAAGGDLTGNYPNPDIAALAVGTAEIAAGAVTDAKLASDAVTTVKILDANVNLNKLATDSVNSAKIVDGSIVGADISSTANLSVASVTATGAVTSDSVSTRSIGLFELPVNGTNYVAHKAPDSLAGNTTYTWPAAAPGSNMVLQSDASGNLSWVADAVGSAPGDASYAAKGVVQFDTDAATSGITVASGIARLATSGVVAATYGAANTVPMMTVDAFGRVTGVTDTAIALNASAISTGTLPIARGGTNSGTALNNNRMMISSGGAIVEAPAMINGQIMIGSTGAAPTAATLTAGTGVTINNTAGGIEISATGTGGDITEVIAGTGLTGGATSGSATLGINAGGVGTTELANDAVTFAKIQNITDNRLLGRSAGSAGDMQEITISTGLSLAGGVLTATATAPGDASYAAKGVVQFDTDAATSGITVASGIAKLATSGVAAATYGTTAAKTVSVTVDAFGRITTASEQDIALNASAITAGVLPIARGGTNSGTALNNNRMMISSGGAIVEAPALTNGQILIGSTGAVPQAATLTAGTGVTINNTAGGIEISAAGSGGTITALTGDVTASGTGSVTATIPNDTVTFAKFQNITDNRILGRSAGSTGDMQEITLGTGLDLTAGVLTATATAPGDASYAAKGLVQFDTDAATSGITVASGIAKLATSGVAANTYGAAGTVPVMTVDAFGRVTSVTDTAIAIAASQVTSGILDVARGGTGTGALTANRMFIANGLGTALTADTCTVGQVLRFDGTNWLCVASSGLGAANAYVQSGNAFGAKAVLGTTDNNALEFITNSTAKMTILANGNVGIGKTNPSEKLDIQGTFAISGSTSGAVTFAVPAAAGSATYTWPAAAPGSNMVLQSDNTGALSWVAAGGSVADDSLDFNKFADSMTLDASTDIAASGTNVLSITNTGTGNSFVVNDQATDTSPFVISANGMVGIRNPAPLFPLDISNAGVGMVIGADVGNSTRTDLTAKTGAIGSAHYENAQPPVVMIKADSTATESIISVGGNSSSGNAATSIRFFTDPLIDNGVGVERMRIDSTKTDIKGNLSLSGSTSGAVTFAVPAAAGSATYTWPAAAPASNMVLQSDNTGALSWVAGGGAGLANFTESVNTAAPNATVPVVQLLATNAATNVDVALTPKGSGALTAQIANSATSGGNKRGTNAVDWQTSRSNANQVASGQSSVVGGGEQNRASALRAVVVGGFANLANDEYAAVLGGYLNLANGVRSSIGGGYSNQADGDYSTIPGGNDVTAAGYGSFATGLNTTADSYSQTTFGRYNMPKGSETAASWVATDPLFVVGNGTGSGASRSTALMILKNGNVGIGGVTNPSYTLDVNGNAIFWAVTAGTGTAGTAAYRTGNNNGLYAPNSGNDLGIVSAGVERIRILGSNGNVGIGKTNPTDKLDVQGTFAMSGSTSGAVKFAVPAAAGSATYTWPAAAPGSNMVLQSNSSGTLSWVAAGGSGDFLAAGTVAMTGNIRLNGNYLSNDGGNEGIRVTNAGDVNVGTNANPTLMTVTGASGTGGLQLTASDGTDRLLITPSGSYSTNFKKSHASGTLKFESSTGVEEMRIDSTGRVGIGTDQPGATLHIVNEGATAGDLWMTAYGDNVGIHGRRARGTKASPTAVQSGDLLTSFGSYSYYASAWTNGTVGSVNIRASENHTSSAQGSYLTFETTADGTQASTAAERMRIDNAGNVGIGTNAPSEKLEVNGNVKGTIFISSSDSRLKHDIRDVAGLESILKLQGVSWKWNSNNQEDMGVIAQAVEKVLPQLVVTDPKTGFKAVKYNALIAPIIESIKELFSMQKEQGRAMASVQEENQNLKEKMEKLSDENNMMKTYLCQKDPAAPFCR